MLVAGCGSSRRGAEADREDAAAYAQAARQLIAVEDRAGAEAFVRVREALDRCPRAVGGRARQQVGEEARDFLVPVRGQLALAGYHRLAERLASVDAHDDGLREIARAVATIAREDGKLAGTRLDICGFLAGWRRAGWASGFPDHYYRGLCLAAGYRARVVRAAQGRIQDEVVGLARLGLTSRQQVDLYTSVLSPLFAVCNVVLRQ